MHYTGMAAFRTAGFISWDGSLVAASVVLGCALGAAALVVGSGDTTPRNRVHGALLLTLAILSHHFTAMGAVSIVRDPTIVVSETALSPAAMALGIAVAGLAILALSLTGLSLDLRDRRRTEDFVRGMSVARKAEEYQKLLIAELDHRVKNVLARVAVVVQRTREGSTSTDDFVAALEGRIQSMADAHALLSSTRWLGVSLADVVRHELAPYATARNTAIEGPSIVLSAEATQAMAMVMHELVTNAAKYGALSNSHGRVSVRWKRPLNGSTPRRLALEWQETGGPPVAPPTRQGYGTSVICDLIPYELGGRVDLDYATGGVRCKIEIPLEPANGQDRSPTLVSGGRSGLQPDAVSPAAILR
jgi:two-component sensor histidine kinase